MTNGKQKVILQVPVDLHTELKRRSEEQGVSMNQLALALLAGGVGFKLSAARSPARASGGRRSRASGRTAASPPT
jgi:hypothetical protein